MFRTNSVPRTICGRAAHNLASRVWNAPVPARDSKFFDSTISRKHLGKCEAPEMTVITSNFHSLHPAAEGSPRMTIESDSLHRCKLPSYQSQRAKAQIEDEDKPSQSRAKAKPKPSQSQANAKSKPSLSQAEPSRATGEARTIMGVHDTTDAIWHMTITHELWQRP